jgi:hypothetical protein
MKTSAQDAIPAKKATSALMIPVMKMPANIYTIPVTLIRAASTLAILTFALPMTGAP